jgi:hypothetical protein
MLNPPQFSTVEELHTWSKANPLLYCCHQGTGRLVFDPLHGTKHFDPWWMLLVCDKTDEIQKYYAWFLKKYGRNVMLSKLWGTHVSVVKHEEPPLKDQWGKIDVEVTFNYAHTVRCDNGKHAWLDVYSPQLSDIRQSLGLPAKEWFHLTIGLTDWR